jgi:uncharacterized delta-60 repeat protein
MFKSLLFQSLSALSDKNLSIYFSILLFCSFSLFAFEVPAQAPGSLDPTFSGDGIVYSGFPSFGGSAYAFAGSVVQPDNKVVIAGEVQRDLPNGSHFEAFGILRFKVDGTLDESFGTGGEFTTDVGDARTGTALAVQPDGKILFAGISGLVGFESVLIRLNSDGTFDTTFNNTGIVRSRFGSLSEGITEVMVQPDGKIVTAGWAIINVAGSSGYLHFLISRFNPDGSLDSSFNNTGRIAVGFNGRDAYQSGAVLQPDGKIVAVGNTDDYYLAAVRVNPNGTLDTSFGDGGKTIISQVGTILIGNAALQADNKIVLAGRTQYTQNLDFALARLAVNGTLDTTFGENGLVKTDFGALVDEARDVVIQANGKILAAGYTAGSFGFDFALARYNANGSLDASFGTNGKVTTSFTNEHDQADSISLQRDGRIVVSGTVYNGAFGVARYFGDFVAQKPPVFDYDGDGKADISVFRPSAGEWYIARSSDGAFSGTHFGADGDLIAPADFDGDGKTDICLFRPSAGSWYRLNSSNNSFTAVRFGAAEDLPVPGDFDGDGRADISIYRPSAGSWYRLNSSNNQSVGVQFGIAEDKPIVGDFDGDGKSDLTVYRPSNGTWYRINSSNDSFSPNQFGTSEDKPVAADYDGDGKTDLAVYRPSVGDWYRINSSNSDFIATHFGVAEDKPAPADFDGDGRADLVVFRPSTGTWYLLRTSAGFTGVQFGANGDLPTPSAFVR